MLEWSDFRFRSVNLRLSINQQIGLTIKTQKYGLQGLEPSQHAQLDKVDEFVYLESLVKANNTRKSINVVMQEIVWNRLSLGIYKTLIRPVVLVISDSSNGRSMGRGEEVRITTVK